MIYTTKVSEENPIAIIGTPRSGTGYAAHYFNVGHEKWTARGISSWKLVSLKGLWEEPHMRIFHQTRNPIKVISSMTTMSDKTFGYVFSILKRPLSDSRLHNSMVFWLEWNKLAEKITDKRYRVEDIDTENKAHNARNHRDFTPEKLRSKDEKLWDEIVELAEKYGYDIKI
jgi:hypothetical protein